jgi:NAD(P)-dependent dehydrogenase (short-subunit alcohol dehydrogenase family)
MRLHAAFGYGLKRRLMTITRLNPVTLITGAAGGIGVACARALSRQSQGGLILVDADEAGLDVTADRLRTPPERVSMLAIDVTDAERWSQAMAFIKSQYGRLDWAIVNAGAARAQESELVSFGASADLDAAALSIRAVVGLMRHNAQGGAVIVTADIPGDSAALSDLSQAAAEEARADRVRINAIALGSAPHARRQGAPLFQDMARDHGGQRGALEALAQLAPPLARYAETEDIAEIITMLLADDSALTGATFVIDGGYAS